MIIWSSNLSSEYTPKGNESVIWKDICVSMFNEALFIMAKIWKQPEYLFIDEWINKTWYIYSDLKKKIRLFATTWMNLEDIILSEISQTQGKKKVWSHLCVKSKNKSQKHRSKGENGGYNRQRGGGSKELLIKGYKIAVMQDE